LKNVLSHKDPNTTEIQKQKAEWELSQTARETHAPRRESLSAARNAGEAMLKAERPNMASTHRREQKTLLERVHHAQPWKRWWSERRLSVDDGDAEEVGGEERVM